MMQYLITPVAKPRQTRSDVWKKRPAVLKYRAFADEVRAAHVQFLNGNHVIFYLPMPSSWSKKKRIQMCGEAHRVRPDLDNLCKALFDALYGEDSHVWDFQATKLWGEVGMIEIGQTLCPECHKTDEVHSLAQKIL